jgi:hypothetical protein
MVFPQEISLINISEQGWDTTGCTKSLLELTIIKNR